MDENMKITDLCDDLLKSIEIEVKYTNREKIQKDFKAKITHFFLYLQHSEGFDIGGKPLPSYVLLYEDSYEEEIEDGDWPAWQPGHTIPICSCGCDFPPYAPCRCTPPPPLAKVLGHID